jgi:hypothetical protein
MHDYSIDRHPKEKILFVLALLSISAAPWINQSVSVGLTDLGVATGLWKSTVITVVPVFGLYLSIYWLFNNKLWKVGWLRARLLVPDLNGKWVCEGVSVLRRGEKIDFRWQGEVRITQSWTKISIHLQTTQSSSKSVSASISQEPGVGYRLVYSYRNDPDASEIDLQKHDGSAEIVFDEDCLSASGNYFTDRHRMTVGTLKLTKVL